MLHVRILRSKAAASELVIPSQIMAKPIVIASLTFRTTKGMCISGGQRWDRL
jgi:hypothetical protein